ncbi:phasin family protein [Pseudomonas sp. NCCP-436]|uniref:phasin family protein n=1 Tax=Pseudomonas sp. NCCP-436 TaxID=2842481 RepID=UPI001C804413|nr:phasin family protein [Pseudomonas sp. NCCP-436]GIZ12774.1 hypothetical protein NCCP436_21900 [Pseudomonas sp. NCCP-436]
MSKVAVEKDVEIDSQAKNGLLGDVKGYARKIYLAGLGAYAKAGAEGLEYFRELVKTGEQVEGKGRKRVDEQVEAANSRIELVKNNVTELKGKVDVQLERIERAFDTRVAAGLSRLGIPSRQDVEMLSAKLDELSALLEHVARTK